MSARFPALAGLLIAFIPAAASAQPAERLAAGKSKSPAAAFAARSAGESDFKLLPENADLYTGDLLVTLPGAALDCKNGAVAVKSLADYDGKSPLPALETAFTLNDPKDVDLDLTLDRGRIDLTSLKADGAARVRVRFWDQTWTIALDGKGTRVALELCGRWPAGSRFKLAKGTEKPAEPVASLVMLVVSGSATADFGGFTIGLKAPPGPAFVEWDSLLGTRPQPQKLDKLPEWADPENLQSEEAKKAAAAIEKFRAARAEHAATALKSYLESDDRIEQRIALITLGATDDLEPLGRSLASARTPEQWDFGITIVRHWLGRCPGHDQKLYAMLTSPAQGYSPAHARTMIQLLLGFSPDDLRQPETFEVLIEYLKHEQRAVRNLAAWHLVRLAPQGKSIGFKPNGTPEEFDAAYQAWKKLIPSGTLPPAAKKE
jgi:hypothetical protein